MTLSAVLVRELTASRSRFNAQVAVARLAGSGFDNDALNDAVRTRIDPLAVAVEALAPHRTAAVVEAAFALNVALVVEAMVGRRRELIDRVWNTAAVALAASVAEQPEPTLAMLTNAVLRIAATFGARPEEWITRMAALGPLVTVTTLPAVGRVVAWRSGMAHYRQAALALAASLPEPLALQAIGATGSWQEINEALTYDRWWTPEPVARVGVRFGGFVGFGGPFESPPEVRTSMTQQGFAVRSGRKIGLLVADAWGATLQPSSENDFNRAMAGFTGSAGQSDDGSHRATLSDSVAIASRYSHFIQVQRERWR